MTDGRRDWLAERFEEHRPRLRAVAYRMLGSLSEADDAVQEAWLRLSRADADEVENLGGWLTTVVARVCLNMLRSRRQRREEPLDVHVPDPIVSPEDGVDPEHEALLADSVGLALLVVLDTLTPGRAARVRAARHVRRAVRRDRADGRAVPGRGPAARQPGPPPGAGRGARARPRPRPPARGGRRLLRRRPRRRLRRAGRRARPRRRAARRRRRRARPARPSCMHGARAVAGQASPSGGSSPFVRPALVNGAAGRRGRRRGPDAVGHGASPSRDGRIVAIDVLADPDRLAAIDLTALGG